MDRETIAAATPETSVSYNTASKREVVSQPLVGGQTTTATAIAAQTDVSGLLRPCSSKGNQGAGMVIHSKFDGRSRTSSVSSASDYGFDTPPPSEDGCREVGGDSRSVSNSEHDNRVTQAGTPLQAGHTVRGEIRQ